MSPSNVNACRRLWRHVGARVFLGVCALSCLLLFSQPAAAQGRPIYIFAHRANDAPPSLGQPIDGLFDNDIQTAIDHGANAIEFDLHACSGGWRVNHDGCNALGAITLDQWLKAYTLARNRANLRAINFDIKASASEATPARMQQLINQARAAIPADVLVIYSTGVFANRSLLLEIAQGLRGNEAVTIDAMSTSDGTAQDVINFFKARSITNLVYADGVSALVPTPSSVRRNLDIAVANRDTVRDVKLVYSWTYERQSTIEEMLLQRRLDGIMVNDCAVVICADPIIVADDGLDNAIDVDQANNSIRRSTGNDLRSFGFHALQPAALSAINF